jgi:hypothetical protein
VPPLAQFRTFHERVAAIAELTSLTMRQLIAPEHLPRSAGGWRPLESAGDILV